MKYIYILISILLYPFSLIYFLIRIFKGKENIKSVLNKLSLSLPENNFKNVIWINAASVGEVKIAYNLIEALTKYDKKLNFILTSGTLTSAEIIVKLLPENSKHQFVPTENYFAINKFLKHWKPKLAIFIEEELWPVLLDLTSKKCKIILANARLSDKSYNNWSRYKSLFKFITSKISLILTQSEYDYKKYKELDSKNLINLGNIKFSYKKLSFDSNKLELLINNLTKKKIFVAASTHSSDEKEILPIVQALSKQNIITILILRHPIRLDEVVKQCNKLNLKSAIRSDRLPNISDDIYIIDCFGEIGLFYELAEIVYIGGSFDKGGHNVLEAAWFDNAIICGPNMTNSKDITNEMIENNALIQINNGDDLETKISYLFSDKGLKEKDSMKLNALNYVKNKNKVIEDYIDQIKKFI